MAVSEERIDELLEEMLRNADENGWCHIPDNLTDDEERELSRKLAIIAMQDRIDVLLEGILKVLEYMEMVSSNIGKYTTIDVLKIKKGLVNIKEDSQGLLMDLHSTDIIKDFFRIEMLYSEDGSLTDEAQTSKNLLDGLVNTEFKDQLLNIKRYCDSMVDMSNDLILKLDKNDY